MVDGRVVSKIAFDHVCGRIVVYGLNLSPGRLTMVLAAHSVGFQLPFWSGNKKFETKFRGPACCRLATKKSVVKTGGPKRFRLLITNPELK